jgi:hypothetical protein
VSLRLLELHSIYLSADELIQLCLIASKHVKSQYIPWETMEELIHKTCKAESTYGHAFEGQDTINKIKTLVESGRGRDKVINNFNTLLAHHGRKGKISEHNYPSFPASIHCESYLVAVLSLLHDSYGQKDSELQETCPSSHYSSPFTL